jgi:maltose/moltooligosaccharide transporter
MSNPFRLALYWLGIQAVWGALLGISLQSRSLELASSGALVWYGRLATGGAFVAAITQICVGIWSDRRRSAGSRRIGFYAFGAIAGSAAIFAFYGARTPLELAAAFVAVQFALNVAGGPYQAIIPDFVERSHIGIASSWMAALQGVGNAAGALLASFIAPARALAATLCGLLLAMCAATALHVRGLQLRPAPIQQHTRFTRAFVDLFISRALMYVGFYTLLGYLFFYVTATLGSGAPGDAKRETGILIVVFTIVGSLGAALAAKPTDRWDKRIVATAGGAAFIAALACFVAAHGTAQIIAATVLAGAGWGIFLVADWAIACRVLPPQSMASGMGIWNLAIVLPQIIAPALTTVVLAHLSLAASPAGPRVAFTLALGETSLGVAWLWRLSRSAIGE